MFKVGRKYTTRSICDSDVKWIWTVTKRTEKRITVKSDDGETRTIGFKSQDGEEIAFPLGRYSMAPMIRSNRYL